MAPNQQRTTQPDMEWLWRLSRIIDAGHDFRGADRHFPEPRWRIPYPDWEDIRIKASREPWLGVVTTTFGEKLIVDRLFGYVVDRVPPARPGEEPRWPELVLACDRRV